MTVAMPDPIPLEDPPGDPEAVDELARDVSGAATLLAGLTDELTGPAAAAPGWLGDDATAAEAQVARVAGIVREAAAAVLRATGRLSAHGDLLGATRRGVRRLRDEQDEDFRSAWRRLGQIEDPRLAVMTGAPAWVGVIEEVEASEASRRRRYEALLEELADDAAATARTLADASRPVGGTGRPGDDGRVLAYLAAELPGWGDPEMAARGVALAHALAETSLTPEERTARAEEALAYAGNPAFATTLIRGLGTDGVAGLLRTLGYDPEGAADDPVAALLAASLGAAVPGGSPRDGVAAVLGATYIRSDDRTGADETAIGMAAVLVAGTRSGGPRMTTVAEWARQLAVRERTQDLPAGMTTSAWGRGGEAGDPLAIAVGTLARGDDPAVAAALLGDGQIWETLLDRFWGDGGAALGDLVTQAAHDAGPAGDRAVRLGLETIGAGLVEGDPTDRTVDRDVVAAVSPALGEAVAAHVPVAAEALASVAAGAGGERTVDLVKGLGYLTVDRRAAATVEVALSEWTVTQSWDLDGTSASDPLPAVAVPSAYLAVQDYGQRLTHALDGHELQDEAENRKVFWDWTAGLLLEVVSYAPAKPIAVAADVIGAYAPLLLGTDGSFEVPPDRGLRYGADDASAGALAVLPPDVAARASAVTAQAEASFRRTAGVLGAPEAPESVEQDWNAAHREVALGFIEGEATDRLVEHANKGDLVDFLPGRK